MDRPTKCLTEAPERCRTGDLKHKENMHWRQVYGLTWGIGEKTSSHKLRTCGELGLDLQGNRVHACPCCGFRVVFSCFPAETHKEWLMDTP